MWRKILLVLMILQVGCGFWGRQETGEANEIQVPTANPSTEEIQMQASPTLVSTEALALPTLANFGSAPELTNKVWLNTSDPLRLADLRGEVVLIEMWTFG